MKKISDVLSAEFLDFCDYCQQLGLVWLSDISDSVFVAFRSFTGCSNEYIQIIKSVVYSLLEEKEKNDSVIVNEEKGIIDNIALKKENVEQQSSLFPSFVVMEQGILEKDTGRIIPDISIHFLGLSTRASNSICRWAKTHGKLKNNTVMLSSILLIKKEEIKGFQNIGEKTWDEIYSTLDAYLSTKEEFSITKEVQPTKDAILPDWFLSGARLNNIKTGKSINDAPLSALFLNVRATNGLNKLGINKISDFVGISYEKLFEVRNLGVGTIAAIISKLSLFLSKSVDDNENNHLSKEETTDDMLEYIPLEGEVFIQPLNPEIPVLADEYAVVDGRIIRRKDHTQIADSLINKLNLSVRGSNCLRQRGIEKISQLVGMPFYDFKSIRNLGVSTSNEIIEKLEFYLDNNVFDANITEIKVLPTEKIISFFDENPFAKIDKNDVTFLFSEEDEDNIFSALNLLIENGTIVFEDNAYRRFYPSFFKILEKIRVGANKPDQRAADVLLLRSKGKTLEEIGQTLNVTRERIRQMESKMFRKVINMNKSFFCEDRLAYLFENYFLDRELLNLILENNNETVYYLNTRYQKGNKSAEEALEDKNLSVELRRQIEKWVYKDTLLVDGERILLSRKEIENFVLKKFCLNGCSFDSFCEKYNDFVLSNNLPPETMHSLLITDDIRKTRINRLSESKKLLWGQNQHLRYYDIESVDFSELFETLNLGQYENIEISTQKFLREFPDLMERYDICDEYELHNLLKKLEAEKENASIHFSRMPLIKFGIFDREQVVKDMLFALAPISPEELAKKISEEYGHGIEFVRGNWFSCINEYYHQGFFSVDYEEMPEEHMELLKANLYDDFYFFSEIKKIYRSVVPDADMSLISSYNLKRMGFKVNGTYAFRNFDSVEAYFRYLFTCKDIVDASRFHGRLKSIKSYYQAWKQLKREYDIIEFEPLQYISISRLNKIGICKEQLRSFCDSVYSFVEKDSYFTIEYLKNQGFTSELDNLGFGTLFYVSLLREDSRFANWIIGNNNLFYVGTIKLFASGNCYISLKSFITYFLNKVKSIDIDELISVFEDEYNIKLKRSSIIQECKDSSLYYDSIMEKVYVDYNTYYEEI